MGLPAQRRSRRSKRQRASHFALKTKQTNACPKCGKAVMPHRACAFCGTYRGRQVLKVTAPAAKKTKAKAKR